MAKNVSEVGPSESRSRAMHFLTSLNFSSSLLTHREGSVTQADVKMDLKTQSSKQQRIIFAAAKIKITPVNSLCM